MNNASLELGGANWAEKDASLLGYTVSDDSGRFFPQEFTFSRGSNLAATRVNKGGLIEKGRENLFTYSNQFDNASWYLFSGTLTSGQSGYDGSNDAWLLTKSGSFGQVRQSISVSNVLTCSVYIKLYDETEADSIFFRADSSSGTASAYFNLSTQSITEPSNIIDSNIESVGDGWFRISMTFDRPITVVRIYPSLGNDATTTTGSIYIQDAQLELGLAASPYIPTTTTTAQAGVLENTPRLNYTTGVANPSLLLEPSRTNLIRYSEYIDGLLKGGNPTLSIESETNPSGNAFAYKVTATGTGSRIQDSLGPQANNFVFSGFFKGTGTATRIQFVNNQGEGVYYDIDTDGTFTLYSEDIVNDNYGIDDYGNGWYRIYFETTTSSVSANYIQVYADALDGDGSVLIWGLQAEQGSYPTSYIPTYSGQSATRAADSCYKTGISSLIGQTEGTVFIDINNRLLSPYPNEYVFRITGTSGDQLWLRKESGANNFTARLTVGGSNAWTISIAPPNGLTKIAIAYKSGDSVVYLNGTQVNASSATFSGNVLENFYFSASSTGNTELKLNQSLLYKERLTNAELTTLTTI